MALILSAALRESASGTYQIYCLGCERFHAIPTITPATANGPLWTFTGDYETPSFFPHVKILTSTKQGDEIVTQTKCHFSITEGRVEYHADSNHKYKGRVVQLPKFKSKRHAMLLF